MISEFRVWHIPQVPGKPFYQKVASPADGARLMKTLAAYDLFQYQNNIKPDYANAQGLQAFEDGEWSDWTDDDGREVEEAYEHIFKEP